MCRTELEVVAIRRNMDKQKEPTPNYNLMFESAVSALQNAYTEYKKAVGEELRWTFFDTDGQFGILSGYEDRAKRTKDAEAEVVRLRCEVDRLRGLKGGD